MGFCGLRAKHSTSMWVGCYLIKLHELKERYFVRSPEVEEKNCDIIFLFKDHISNNITECQWCWRVHVSINGAITFVDINHVAFFSSL